ncbi:MAG: omptin family outer membrane protease [Candidatus Hodarchaeota archaeon]
MKKTVCVLSWAFVIGSLGVPAYAEGPKVDITLGIGKLSGDTTYRIGGWVDTPSVSGEVHFPLSELEFPLDLFMVSVGGSIEFAEKWKVSVGVKKNVTSDAGKVKDSDWGIWYYEISWWTDPDSLDIYSESNADPDALIMEVKLLYRFYEKSNWSFIGGLGYIRQNFNYEVSNLDQWYPSLNDYYGYDIGHDYVSGKVLTYDVTYSIPYIEVATKLKVKRKFSVEASLGYSPFVDAEDEDNHILRSKVSKGDCDGNAILLSLEGRYDFLKHWFLTLQLDYMTIDTDGKQRQYTEGEWTATIDQEIESEQTFAAFALGYEF